MGREQPTQEETGIANLERAEKPSKVVNAIEAASTPQEILQELMTVLHDVGGAFGAREHLKKDNLTPPLRLSMIKQAFTDKEIEEYTLDVWEAAAIKMNSWEKKDGS